MKKISSQKIEIAGRVMKGAFYGVFGVFCLQNVQAQLVIDLSKPVSESVSTITGIYWTGNAITQGTNYPETADSSGNGYTGFLLVGSGTISSITGVSLPGTSGYGNGIRLATNVTAPGGTIPGGGTGVANPQILVNLPLDSDLDLVSKDFSGGTWVNFNSMLSGTQTVNLINRGNWGSNAAGSWGLNLYKDASNNWEMAFQVGNGVTKETELISIPTLTMGIATGEWNHFGFSYDYREEGDNVVTFWMNGVNLGSANISLDIATGTTTASRRFAVGERTTSGYTSVFDGTVDDIFVTEGIYTFNSQMIPEPGIAALMILGGGAFFAGGRKRKTA